MKGMQRRAPVVFSGKLLYCPLIDGITWVLAYARKQRRKNAVVFATEVVDSLLWVERHSGTITGLPPKERLQKHIHWSLQLLFCFPAGTVNFLLLRHENKDRLPSFAVDLDEDPTDIFGAVCALLVFSALLKNWTFLWPCLQWKEYCDFWVNSSANSTKINQCLRTGTGWDMVLKSLLPTFTSVFCMVYTGQGLCPVIFVLLTTRYHRTTLPSLPGERDSEERGYINASHHGGSSCRSYWQWWEIFIAIPELCESWDGVGELLPDRIHQCLYYPQCKAMTSDRKTWLQY